MMAAIMKTNAPTIDPMRAGKILSELDSSSSPRGKVAGEPLESAEIKGNMHQFKPEVELISFDPLGVVSSETDYYE